MCVNNNMREKRFNRTNSVPLGKRLFVKEKVFVLIIKYPELLSTIMRFYLKELNCSSEKSLSSFENVIFSIKTDEESIIIDNLKIVRFAFKNDKLSFNPTIHILEQVFQRKMKYFDWSILCNIYKQAISVEHINSYKYEITNTFSTVNYAINGNVISLITAWNGIR